MTEYIENDDLDDVLGDLSNSDNDKVDSLLIKKILSEMKCEFNRAPVIDESVKDVLGETSLNSSEQLPESTTQNGKNSEDSSPADSDETKTTDAVESCNVEVNNIPESIGNNNDSVNLINLEGDSAENNVHGTNLVRVSSPDNKFVENNVNNTLENEDKEKNSPKHEIDYNSKGLNKIIPVNNSETLKISETETNDTGSKLKVEEETIEHPRIVLKLRPSDDDKDLSKRKSPRISREASKLKSQNESSDLEVEVPERRTRRSRNNEMAEPEMAVKRSSRRMSKEYSRESVLQNAIARKEMSFSTFDKPHRRSTRLSDELKVNAGYRTRNRSTRLNSVSSDTSEKKSSALFENSTEDNEEKKGIRNNNKKGQIESGRPLKPSSKESLNEEGVVDNYLGSAIGNYSDHDSEKGLESSSSVSSHSSLRPKRKNDSSLPPCEEKRQKRSSSPLKTVEESDNKSIKNEGAINYFCECEVFSNLYPNGECIKQNHFCRALDTFEEKLVGCCNPVDEENAVLLRPNKTIPYQQLCDIHIQRMVRHNACPTCGLFCTQVSSLARMFTISINTYTFLFLF